MYIKHLSPITHWRVLMFTGFFSLFAAAQSSTDRTTEAGEAQISDPNAECAPYGYPPVTNALNAFPPIWVPATMIAGDVAAAAKWSAIQASVPNIAPKGTMAGDFSSVNYSPTDPDCWWSYSKCTTPKMPGLNADIAMVPEPRTLGYGFDDGPNCSHNAFYDYLASQNQQATMFYIGSNVMDWPLEAQRAVADGHEICALTSFQSQAAFAELYYTIKLVTGVTPTCWRPPYGDIDDRIRAIAQGLGLRTVLWKYDSNDWQFGSSPNVTSQDVDNNYQSMINDANNGLFANAGTIILTHELDNFTMSEAIKFYPLLKQAFDHIVPVGVSLNVTQPYLETNYTMPSFAQYVAGSAALAGNPINGTGSAPTTSTALAPTSQIASSVLSSSTSNPTTTSLKSKSDANALHSINYLPFVIAALILAGAERP